MKHIKIDAYGLLHKVRTQKPVVHHLTNWVTIYDCANMVKVFGASPVMAHAKEEAAQMARIASSPSLNAAGKERAALLPGATVELNPHGEELLMSLSGNEAGWVDMALPGLETPGFISRLTRGTGITPPPRFKPDYTLRLKVVTDILATVTNEELAARLNQARTRLSQRVSETPQP